MNWIISANHNVYDHSAAFKKNGLIDWKQNVNYEVGDTVFIYSTRPFKCIQYKTIVEQINKPFEECVDDKEFWKKKSMSIYKDSKAGYYVRLRLLNQIDSNELTLDKLKKHGLKTAPQNPQKMSDELVEYVEKFF